MLPTRTHVAHREKSCLREIVRVVAGQKLASAGLPKTVNQGSQVRLSGRDLASPSLHRRLLNKVIGSRVIISH